MKNKKITIEKLAAMVHEGFKETAKKVDMDAGFKKIDERLRNVETKLEEDFRPRIRTLEDAMGTE